MAALGVEIIGLDQGLALYAFTGDLEPAANDHSSVDHDRPSRGPYQRHKPRREDKRCSRVSRQCSVSEIAMVEEGFAHARRIGLPLNQLVTVRPSDNDNLTPIERRDRFTEIRHRLDQHCRDRGFSYAAAWSRESRPRTDGWGEHLHVLMHVPHGELPSLRAMLERRHPDASEVDIRRRDQATRTARCGQPYTAASYLVKAIPTTMRRLRAFWQPSGPVFGKRVGVTRNLAPKAIAAWRKRDIAAAA